MFKKSIDCNDWSLVKISKEKKKKEEFFIHDIISQRDLDTNRNKIKKF